MCSLATSRIVLLENGQLVTERYFVIVSCVAERVSVHEHEMNMPTCVSNSAQDLFMHTQAYCKLIGLLLYDTIVSACK